MKGKTILLGSASIVGLLLLYLFFWPVGLDPAAWDLSPAPGFARAYETNDGLASVERLETGDGFGPEDVAVDGQGRIYGGLEDGRIVRFQPDGTGPETFAATGGRPLGLHFDAAGNLIVADAYKGLLSVAPDGTVRVLSTEQGDLPYRFTDDVDIGADGTIYFSDASSKYSYADYSMDILEHRPYGRLLAYDPAAKATRLLLGGLYMANGVAVSPDQRFVLVVETGMFRVVRYWLAGPRKGESEIFVEDLPGFPDGVSSDGKGIFWVAIASPRKPGIDVLLGSRFLRKMMLRLPKALWPAPAHHGIAFGFDLEGRLVHNLQDRSDGAYGPVMSVQQHGGTLYLGSIVLPAIGRLPAP